METEQQKTKGNEVIQYLCEKYFVTEEQLEISKTYFHDTQELLYGVIVRSQKNYNYIYWISKNAKVATSKGRHQRKYHPNLSTLKPNTITRNRNNDNY